MVAQWVGAHEELCRSLRAPQNPRGGDGTVGGVGAAEDVALIAHARGRCGNGREAGEPAQNARTRVALKRATRAVAWGRRRPGRGRCEADRAGPPVREREGGSGERAQDCEPSDLDRTVSN